MHREIKGERERERERECVCVERYKVCLCRECVHVERGESVCVYRERDRECMCM